MLFKRFERRIFSNFDWPLFISMTLLCLAGLGVLYSAGFNPETGNSAQMRRQMASMGLGLVVFVMGIVLNTSFWRRAAFVIYALGCVLLIMILVKGVVVSGARRWLDLGGFRMQPAEFMKLGLILTLARLFSNDGKPRDGYSFFGLLLPGGLIALPMALIMLEPDLGTALCHLMVGGSMLLLAGIQPRTMLRLVVIGAVLAYPAWSMLHDYQQKRILNFLSPEMDPLGTGYHAIQSKIAVGSGALTGKGFLKGTQTQLRFLPEQTTDFIFSVLAEEWGFVGSILVVALYSLLILRLLNISSRSPDRFAAFVAFGVAALFFWQVVLNIGMVIGVLPVVGITLPLLSYGGSSVVTLMAALGISAGISIRRFLFSK